nr:helix-turn-helix domain-containing protein [uncultured Arsenicibacter sp.]
MPFSSKDQIARRRAQVATLYLKGWQQAAIAEELDVTQSQISQDLKAIRENWKTGALIDFNEAKARELARLDLLEQTYWSAWERSLKPFKKKQTKMRGEVNMNDASQKQKAKNLETTEATEERVGDPKFLDGVLKCIQKRVDILGIDAPSKQELTGKDGKPLNVTIFKIPDNGR